jgi:hypothetical protein
MACVLATIAALLAAANVPAAEAPKADGAAFHSATEEKPAAGQPAAGAKGEKPKAEEKKEAAKPKDPYAWRSMFDGKTLKGWKVPKFGGDGEVKVVDGAISIGMGDGVTGIAYTGELPKINYEFRMEARRTMGIDFFATTTFPYNEDPCSLVVGGWAGAVVGLSCVDYYDASDNITTKYMSFKDKQWYRIHIRVSQQRIEAWIDNEKVVDLATKGHKISIRNEVDLCRPFGIATWCTEGQLRKLEIRSLKPEEVEEIPVRDRWD